MLDNIFIAFHLSYIFKGSLPTAPAHLATTTGTTDIGDIRVIPTGNNILLLLREIEINFI